MEKRKRKLDSEEVVGAATENKEESPCPEEASPGRKPFPGARTRLKKRTGPAREKS